MIDLSRYVFEALRKDEEFILYRGRSGDDEVRVLVASPAVEYPAPETLKLLEHGYNDPDKTKAGRVATEMLKQVKFNIAKLKRAFNGR